MRITYYLFLSLFLISGNQLYGQELTEPTWISYPSANNTQYGVYLFRKKATFVQRPE